MDFLTNQSASKLLAISFCLLLELPSFWESFFFFSKFKVSFLFCYWEFGRLEFSPCKFCVCVGDGMALVPCSVSVRTFAAFCTEVNLHRSQWNSFWMRSWVLFLVFYPGFLQPYFSRILSLLPPLLWCCVYQNMLAPNNEFKRVHSLHIFRRELERN